jgi:hypothetical protein
MSLLGKLSLSLMAIGIIGFVTDFLCYSIYELWNN